MGGINVAEEMMRDVVALMKGDLVGGDVKSSVDLYFIGVDYLETGEELSKFY